MYLMYKFHLDATSVVECADKYYQYVYVFIRVLNILVYITVKTLGVFFQGSES